MSPATGVAARLERAFSNFRETFLLFAAAVIAAHLAGNLGDLMFWCSAFYVTARAVYVPVYVAGYGWRFIVWAISMIGLLMAAAAVFS